MADSSSSSDESAEEERGSGQASPASSRASEGHRSGSWSNESRAGSEVSFGRISPDNNESQETNSKNTFKESPDRSQNAINSKKHIPDREIGSEEKYPSHSKRKISTESNRSGSPVSERSRTPASERSVSPLSHKSASPESKHSRSSGSPKVVKVSDRQNRAPRKTIVESSKRSETRGSPKTVGRGSGSRSPDSHRSASPRSQRSGSPDSERSASPHSQKSASPQSVKSGSPGSRSGSPGSQRSGSERSRSATPGSHKSRSVERTVKAGSPRSGGSDSDDGSHKSSSPDRDKVDTILNKLGSPSSGNSEASKDEKPKDGQVKDLSDSDEDPPDNTNVTKENLFGDANDISSESENEEGIRRVPISEMEEDDGTLNDEDQLQEPPETRIEVEIPRINTRLGKQLYFVKLPNFLSVDTRPYDAQTYEDEIDEDDVLDEEGRARLKLKVENTIRWRVKKDEDGNDVVDESGETVKESNARVVQWSDGSMSLHLGEEVFDIHVMPLQDYNHLFVRQGTGLQGQAVFRAKLTFRPSSTESMTHRKMTMSLADRSLKTQKVKVLPIAGHNPDAHRSEMIKREEEKLRASMRRESHQRRMRERQQARNISSSYLEGGYDDDEYEEDISISAIKNRYKQGAAKRDIYSSDSDEHSESDGEQTKRLEKAKRIVSDEEASGSDAESQSKKKKARIVESDDDDDEDIV